MSGTVVVPYERFLDVRQRRNRAAATLTQHPLQTIIEDILDDRSVAVDREAPNDESGTAISPDVSPA
jgi:hypothetical protein